jgi:hypothetical protein
MIIITVITKEKYKLIPYLLTFGLNNTSAYYKASPKTQTHHKRTQILKRAIPNRK